MRVIAWFRQSPALMVGSRVFLFLIVARTRLALKMSWWQDLSAVACEHLSAAVNPRLSVENRFASVAALRFLIGISRKADPLSLRARSRGSSRPASPRLPLEVYCFPETAFSRTSKSTREAAPFSR